MNFNEINTLTITDCLDILRSRLNLGPLDEALASDLEAELILYKSELTLAEQARLDEIARREALESRFSALDDLRLCMERVGDKTPNMALFKRDIIDSNNVALLESLETANAEIKSEQATNAPILARAEEYAKIDKLLLEALAENAAGRPQKMIEYLSLRQAIVDDNPKVS